MLRFLTLKSLKTRSFIKPSHKLKKIAYGTTAIAFGLLGYSEFIGTKIDVKFSEKNDFNNFAISRIEELRKKYRGTPYLPTSLLEMITAARIEAPPNVPVHHEKIYLEDGDTLDIGMFLFS